MWGKSRYSSFGQAGSTADEALLDGSTLRTYCMPHMYEYSSISDTPRHLNSIKICCAPGPSQHLYKIKLIRRIYDTQQKTTLSNHHALNRERYPHPRKISCTTSFSDQANNRPAKLGKITFEQFASDKLCCTTHVHTSIPPTASDEPSALCNYLVPNQW